MNKLVRFVFELFHPAEEKIPSADDIILLKNTYSSQEKAIQSILKAWIKEGYIVLWNHFNPPYTEYRHYKCLLHDVSVTRDKLHQSFKKLINCLIIMNF